jgi:hypothetical protein
LENFKNKLQALFAVRYSLLADHTHNLRWIIFSETIDYSLLTIHYLTAKAAKKTQRKSYKPQAASGKPFSQRKLMMA